MAERNPAPNQFRCPGCGREFVTHKGLNLHQKRYCRPQAAPAPTPPQDDPPEPDGSLALAATGNSPPKTASHNTRDAIAGQMLIPPTPVLSASVPSTHTPDSNNTGGRRTLGATRLTWRLPIRGKSSHFLSSQPSTSLKPNWRMKVPLLLTSTLLVGFSDQSRVSGISVNYGDTSSYGQEWKPSGMRHQTSSSRHRDLRTSGLLRTPPPAAAWPSPSTSDVPTEEDPGLITIGPDSPFKPPSVDTGSPPAGSPPIVTIDEAPNSATTTPPGPDYPDPNPPSPDGGNLEVDDPVRAYLISLVSDPTTSAELRRFGVDILSRDADLVCPAIRGLYEHLWPPHPSRTGEPQAVIPPPPRNAAQRTMSTRARRAYSFKRSQELYVKDKAALANRIVGGIEFGAEGVAPSVDEISRHYQQIFAGAAPEDQHAVTDRRAPTPGLYLPLTEEDIRIAIGYRRASNSAGPDGMTAADLRRLPLRGGVAIFLNATLYTGYIPPP